MENEISREVVTIVHGDPVGLDGGHLGLGADRHTVFLGEGQESLGQPADAAADEPAPIPGLDVGNDGEGGGGQFRIAAVVGGEPLEKLLQMGSR